MASRISITPNMVQGLRVALGASSFADLSPRFLPVPETGQGPSVTNQTLFALADEIGQRDEARGIGLFRHAVRAAQASHSSQLRSAWGGFARLISGGQGPEDETAREVLLVSLETFRKVMGILRDPAQRVRWIQGGIMALGVPSPRELIDSSPLSLQEKGAVTFSVVQGKKGFFQTYVEQYSPHISASLHFVIVTPGDWSKPLTEEEVYLLIARAFLFEDLAARGGLELARPYQTVASDRLQDPLSVVLVGSKGVAPYLPLAVTKPRKGEWEEVWGWFAYGIAVLNQARRGVLLSAEAEQLDSLLSDRLRRRIRGLEAPESVQRSWLDVIHCLNTLPLFRGTFNRLAIQSPRIRFDVQEALGESVQIRLEGENEPFIGVSLSLPSLRALRGEDLLEIAWRALTLREETDREKTGIDVQTGGESRRRARYQKIPDKGLLTLSELRQGTGLSPQMRIGRSYLGLLFAYFQGMKGEPLPPGPPRVEIEGPALKATNRALASALSAIGRHVTMTPIESERVAWEDVLSARRWYVQETGEEGEQVLAEVIPLGSTQLVHLHGKNVSLSPLDWLFLLSLTEVNLGAIRVNVTGRTVILGRSGDSNILYNGVAAQRILSPFGVYDPSARLPENWDLALPGGVSATLNPNLSRASQDLRRRYLKALRWFASKGIPSEWQPIATDSLDRVRDRQRLMMLAWHPDRKEITGVTPAQVALFTESLPHWRAVIDLAALKK